MRSRPDHPVIGVVGVCGCGKTTLVNRLKLYGLEVKHIAQEHSYVGYMWQRIAHPDVLIFLDATFPETIKRRHLNWTIEEYQEQQRRLAHARQNCDLYLFTDSLTPAEVTEKVLEFFAQSGIQVNPLP